MQACVSNVSKANVSQKYIFYFPKKKCWWQLIVLTSQITDSQPEVLKELL